MSLILLGAYAQTMLSALSGGPFRESGIKDLLRLVVEGIGEQRSPSEVSPSRKKMPVPIVNPIRWRLIENRAMLLLDV